MKLCIWRGIYAFDPEISMGAKSRGTASECVVINAEYKKYLLDNMTVKSKLSLCWVSIVNDRQVFNVYSSHCKVLNKKLILRLYEALWHSAFGDPTLLYCVRSEIIASCHRRQIFTDIRNFRFITTPFRDKAFINATDVNFDYSKSDRMFVHKYS